MNTCNTKYSKPFVTSKELHREVLPNIGENKLYEILNMSGCPKINIGRKYLIPVDKFIEWFESLSV